jgi:hypothetical protein
MACLLFNSYFTLKGYVRDIKWILRNASDWVLQIGSARLRNQGLNLSLISCTKEISNPKPSDKKSLFIYGQYFTPRPPKPSSFLT